VRWKVLTGRIEGISLGIKNEHIKKGRKIFFFTYIISSEYLPVPFLAINTNSSFS